MKVAIHASIAWLSLPEHLTSNPMRNNVKSQSKIISMHTLMVKASLSTSVLLDARVFSALQLLSITTTKSHTHTKSFEDGTLQGRNLKNPSLTRKSSIINQTLRPWGMDQLSVTTIWARISMPSRSGGLGFDMLRRMRKNTPKFIGCSRAWATIVLGCLTVDAR